MKSIQVPYVKTLDTLELSAMLPIFESEAKRINIDIVNWGEYPYKPQVTVDIARGKNDLFLHYTVKGNSIKAVYTADNSSVHEDSCVEFFMKKTDADTYMNFEFNCIGTCDAASRFSKTEKTSLTEDEYDQIRRFSTISGGAFEEKEGVFSWELTVAIPFNLMGLDSNNLPEKIKANFYKCADLTADPHFLSWSPINLPEPNFHCPAFFGELYF